MVVKQIPESPVIARVFDDLAREWQRETGHFSDMERAKDHPVYRAIIALGPMVVPSMLRNLRSNDPMHWFTALRDITGEDPVQFEDWGNVRRMAQSWVKWGEEHGYTA